MSTQTRPKKTREVGKSEVARIFYIPHPPRGRQGGRAHRSRRNVGFKVVHGKDGES